MSDRVYAVKRGRKRGVFFSFEECQEQVLGYSGALYKRFFDIDEAFIYAFDPVDYIYTDGASKGNQFPLTAIAGYGVFFGQNDCRNIAEPLPGDQQTNQRAELYAIYAALEHIWLNNDFDRKFVIISDSQYAINCVTVWYKIWEDNDWTTCEGTPVVHANLIREIIKMKGFINRVYIAFGWSDIKIRKIAAHSGVYGNEMADKLANMGCDKNDRNHNRYFCF